MAVLLPPPVSPPPPPPPDVTGVDGDVSNCLALAMLVAICMIPEANCAIPAVPAVTPFNGLVLAAATKADIALAVSIPICTNADALLNLASLAWSLISSPPKLVSPSTVSLAKPNLASLICLSFSTAALAAIVLAFSISLSCFFFKASKVSALPLASSCSFKY